MSLQARSLVTPTAFVAAALIVGLVAGDYWLTVLTVAVVYTLACLSLVVLTGWSGQLNLHVAALGLGWGAYAAYALQQLGLPPTLAVLGAAIATIPFALAVGAVAVRFRGLELAVATLAIGLIFERVAFRNIGKWLSDNGSSTFESSFVPVSRPGLASSDAGLYLFALAVAVMVFVVAARVARSATGRALHALREREAAAETTGIPVVRWRAGAFAASIAIAATAGALLAAVKQGVAPDSFNIDLSFRLLAAVVIGGIGSTSGAVLGGMLVALLPEVTQFGPLKALGGERLFVVFGGGMILTLWRLPGGLASLPGVLRRRRALVDTPEFKPEDEANPVVVPSQETPRGTVLRVAGARVRFGGIVALDDADIAVRAGEIVAIIGPNGAGKSTLFNVVAGLITPDAGRIYLSGNDVTELSAARRAAAGIARTYQTVEVFRSLSVRDNIELAAHVRVPPRLLAEALGLPSARRSRSARAAIADELMQQHGLQAVGASPASDLPLGTLRVLEAAMSLAAMPRLLLLDEPSAGLDAAETEALGNLIVRARDERGLGVLIVEHDMALVEQIADRVIVLDFGRVIAQGTPAQIRRDPIVLARYLGDEDQEAVDALA